MKHGALEVENPVSDEAVLVRAPDAEAKAYELPARSIGITRKGSKVGVNLTGPFCTLADFIDNRHTAGEVLDALIAENRDTTVDVRWRRSPNWRCAPRVGA